MEETALRLSEEGWELRWEVEYTNEDDFHAGFTSYWHAVGASPYLYLPCFKGEYIFDSIMEVKHAEYSSY